LANLNFTDSVDFITPLSLTPEFSFLSLTAAVVINVVALTTTITTAIGLASAGATDIALSAIVANTTALTAAIAATFALASTAAAVIALIAAIAFRHCRGCRCSQSHCRCHCGSITIAVTVSLLSTGGHQHTFAVLFSAFFLLFDS
jgi:hypothetical protein